MKTTKNISNKLLSHHELKCAHLKDPNWHPTNNKPNRGYSLMFI